ncbi:CYTH domain-containing protein [Latilactobacillus graminis]|uniref:CYTH domain protein n=2 Tax=Latilactobacillus graminis TaxID=60519 RepID=A0AA89HZQ8_9LACO|nr:CYTH domain-containing protein [Latilactobacillus graminis]KRM21079.1 CYTH domain protein [Latilactobacillus graminis DSM 20719]QFP79208.1 CYTH domain-containing protein [Latilactobacillus graminis]
MLFKKGLSIKTQAIEREFKTMLTADQFNHINRDYPFIAPFSQTNYYFELPKQGLASRHWGLRIRRFATFAEQTLKVPMVKATHSLLEITDQLTNQQAIQAIERQQPLNTGQVAAYLVERAIELADLFIWGQATTQRQTCPLPNGLLTLDYTHYPDQTQDYEIELEVHDIHQGAATFEKLTSKYQLSQQPPRNKVARAHIHQR